MRGLPPPFVHLTIGAQQAVHGGHRTEVAPLIQQCGIDGGRRLVHEPLAVQLGEHGRPLSRAERPWLRPRRLARPRWPRGGAVVTVMGGASTAHRGTGGLGAHHRDQLLQGEVHQLLSSPLLVGVGALLVAS